MHLPRRRSTVTIGYKSGAKVRVRAKSFKVTRLHGGGKEAEWENVWPRPLLFGIDDVAAIYEGRA
jgi:hypothetical protein